MANTRGSAATRRPTSRRTPVRFGPNAKLRAAPIFSGPARSVRGHPTKYARKFDKMAKSGSPRNVVFKNQRGQTTGVARLNRRQTRIKRFYAKPDPSVLSVFSSNPGGRVPFLAFQYDKNQIRRQARRSTNISHSRRSEAARKAARKRRRVGGKFA